MVLPYVVATVLGVLLAANSFLAWNAAASVNYPAWVPTVAGLMFAGPILLLAPILAFGTWTRTRSAFRINVIPVLVWFALLCACIALAVAYLLTIGNASSYEGTFNTVTQSYEPLFNLFTFLQVSALLAVFETGALLLVPAKFLYWPAIQTVSAGVQGQDAIGQIIRTSQETGHRQNE